MPRQAKPAGEQSGSGPDTVNARKDAITAYHRAATEADTMAEDVSEARKNAKEIAKTKGLRADAVDAARKLRKKLDAKDQERWIEDFTLACEVLGVGAQQNLFGDPANEDRPTTLN
jgi:hypothetical protein